MSALHDLRPASDALGQLVANLPAERLTGPTPSEGYRVGDLLEHIDGLSAGLQSAAHKTPVAPEDLRDGDAAQLRPDWRQRVPTQLTELALAWAEPSAWEGETVEGGVPLPAQVAGMFVLDELVVHGWELARATGQPFTPRETDVRALLDFLSSLPPTDEADGLFGPPVPVAESAPDLDRLVGLTGRDPAWEAAPAEG